MEALQAQLEECESRNKSEANALKKKFMCEVDEAVAKFESAKKAKSDAEAQQKKLQQSNKVDTIQKINIIWLLSYYIVYILII